MDPIVESTRRQNTASAQLSKANLHGLDRYATFSSSYVEDLPEIVVVSVPELTSDESPKSLLSQGISLGSSAQTSSTRRRDPGVSSLQSVASAPVSKPHVTSASPPISSERMLEFDGLDELDQYAFETKSDQPSAYASDYRTSDSGSSALDIRQSRLNVSEINAGSDPAFESEISPNPIDDVVSLTVNSPAAPVADESLAHDQDAATNSRDKVASEPRTRMDSAETEPAAEQETASKSLSQHFRIPLRSRFFSGLFPRRSKQSDSDSSESETSSATTTPLETRTELYDAVEYSSIPSVVAEPSIVDLESGGIDLDAYAVDSTASDSAWNTNVEPDLADTDDQSEIDEQAFVNGESVVEGLNAESESETPPEVPAPTKAEVRAREADARERHGRRIARHLYEHPAIANATTLLLVATGGSGRAMEAVECISRGIAWHRDREIALLSLDTLPEAALVDIEEFKFEDAETFPAAFEVLRNAATLTRFTSSKRLTSIELTVEQHPDNQRLSLEHLIEVTKNAKRDHQYVAWLIDASQEQWCEALGAACDATLMLIDMHTSRVDQSRWAVTHLREHGARMVGSLVINASEEQV